MKVIIELPSLRFPSPRGALAFAESSVISPTVRGRSVIGAQEFHRVGSR